MEISKITQTTTELFNQVRTFHIPQYQRQYSWNGAQVTQLLSDLEFIRIKRYPNGTLEPERSHFIGLIVLVKEEDAPNPDKYNVIDGQQRIATIIILCAAARDVIQIQINSADLSEEGKQKLGRIKFHFEEFVMPEEKPFGQKRSTLKPNKKDHASYQISVWGEGLLKTKEDDLIKKFGKKSVSTNKVFLAYKKLYDDFVINSKKDPVNFFSELYVKISHGLNFIKFTANSDSDAFNIFETLNDVQCLIKLKLKYGVPLGWSVTINIVKDCLQNHKSFKSISCY